MNLPHDSCDRSIFSPEAICHALGSKGGGVHLGAPVNCFLPKPLGEYSPHQELRPLQPEARKRGTWARGGLTHRQTTQSPLSPKHTHAHLKVSPGRDLEDHLIQTFHFTHEESEDQRTQDVPKATRPVSAKGGTWASTPSTPPILLLPRCSI